MAVKFLLAKTGMQINMGHRVDNLPSILKMDQSRFTHLRAEMRDGGFHLVEA